LFLRFFEASGQIRTAVFVSKSRTNEHKRTIHEFRLGRETGIEIGEPLDSFQGILTGLPTYQGSTRMMGQDK
jgi:circadian clock protein KaiC